jgi:protein-disulfide isomerase
MLVADCAHVRLAICKTAGTNSSECRSAQYTLPLLSEKTCAALRADESNMLARLRAIRQPCITLVERLCSDLGPDSDVCEVVQVQTAAFTVKRCNNMLTRYADVLGTLREIAQGTKILTLPEQSLVAEGNRPAFGPAEAKVVLVEFSDFQCPYCKGAAESIREVENRFSSQVRFVFRQFPLPFHPNAQLAAEAALAAHAQGKFWAFHDLLFTHQQALTRRDLERYAATIGLDMDLFRRNLDEHRYASDVAEDIGIGNQVHVSGTPTLFVNGRRVANPSNTPAVLKAVHEALMTELSRSKHDQVMLPQPARIAASDYAIR